MAASAPVVRRRTVSRMLLRPLATVGLSVAVYYLLPLPDRSNAATILLLIAGLATVAVVLAWHVRAIVGSTFPRMRAIEALATAAPMFLLLFAAAYFILASTSTTNFGTRLSRSDTLYFSVTVFSTTGFGDIAPRSEVARLLVTGQMIGDMIFLGLGIRQLVTATQLGLRRRASTAAEPLADDDAGRPG